METNKWGFVIGEELILMVCMHPTGYPFTRHLSESLISHWISVKHIIEPCGDTVTS